MMDEFGIIERFFKRQAVRRDDVVLGIGDDAAVVDPASDGDWVVTTDVLVNGVHFPESTDPRSVGHKALAVNLSDIAAMGAEPAWATMGLTLPGVEEHWLEEFASGFLALAEEFNVQLIGGDTTHGPLTIAVQLIGRTGGIGHLSRGGARTGDSIYVSGTLGDAALALQIEGGVLAAGESDRGYFMDRLNRPSPRVALGRAMVGHATAAIDISDGLAADLGHLCRSSGVGAEVNVDAVPVSAHYRRHLATVGWDPALSFGDDYELCFTVAPENDRMVENAAREADVGVARIGRVTGSGVRWMRGNQPYPVSEDGYRHFR